LEAGVVMLASLLCSPTVFFSVFSFSFGRNVVGGSVAKT
jgi:hypothetical protein